MTYRRTDSTSQPRKTATRPKCALPGRGGLLPTRCASSVNHPRPLPRPMRSTRPSLLSSLPAPLGHLDPPNGRPARPTRAPHTGRPPTWESTQPGAPHKEVVLSPSSTPIKSARAARGVQRFGAAPTLRGGAGHTRDDARCAEASLCERAARSVKLGTRPASTNNTPACPGKACARRASMPVRRRSRVSAVAAYMPSILSSTSA